MLRTELMNSIMARNWYCSNYKRFAIASTRIEVTYLRVEVFSRHKAMPRPLQVTVVGVTPHHSTTHLPSVGKFLAEVQHLLASNVLRSPFVRGV